MFHDVLTQGNIVGALIGGVVFVALNMYWYKTSLNQRQILGGIIFVALTLIMKVIMNYAGINIY